jgi:predicted HTH transcriptional regulator
VLDTPIGQIDKDFIDNLVLQRRPEDQVLDYKKVLPGKNPAAKKEFAKDVCSFANEDGGCILYGIAEDGASRPTQALGISGESADAAVRRLEETLRSWIEPRLSPRPEFREIDGFSNGYVLVLKIPLSYSGPHSAKDDGARIWARGSKGKLELNEEERRQAYVFDFSATSAAGESP